MRRPPRLAVAALVAALIAGPTPVTAPAAGAAPTASTVRAGEWWLSQLHVPSAWGTTKGAGVVVGLLDSGVDATHPDLQGAVVPGKDFSGHGASNGEAPVGDFVSAHHGTTMAGYIVGRGHGPGNGLGLIGVAPEAKVESLSLALGSGGGAPPDPHDVASAMRWAVDHGAKVLNLSIGGDNMDATTRDAFRYAQAHDAVVVVASGNEGQPNGMDQYAIVPGVVAVSGYVDDAKDQYPLDSDSNSNGPETLDPSSTKASDYTAGVAVSGPFSTHDSADDLVGLTPVKDGSYTQTGGTSNAAAIVSGVVALIRSAHRDWSAAQVVDALIHTAYRPPGKGYSTKHGFGIPDAAKAVTAPTRSVCENPLGSLVTDSAGIWPTINRTKDALTYTPTCSGPSTSTPPSSSSQPSSRSSAPTSAGPSTASSAPTSPASAGSGDGGGVPAWVWVVVALVVVGGIAAFLLARRGRRGGPPGGSPPGGWPPPPPGWTPPPPPRP